MAESKFIVNDKVKIVHYGRLFFIDREVRKGLWGKGIVESLIPDNLLKYSELPFEYDENKYYYDLEPKKVGKEGIITETFESKKWWQYKVKFTDGSWNQHPEYQLQLL